MMEETADGEPAVLSRPMPLVDYLSRPFWDAADEERLALQRCQSCHHFQHPPRMVCEDCGSGALAFETAPLTGTVHSLTVVHVARNPAFASILPYAVIWAELDAQPGLFIVANAPGVPPDDLEIGTPVEVWFEMLAGQQRVPQFRLAPINTSAR
jgi:uncharacterized OB-fold protein